MALLDPIYHPHQVQSLLRREQFQQLHRPIRLWWVAAGNNHLKSGHRHPRDTHGDDSSTKKQIEQVSPGDSFPERSRAPNTSTCVARLQWSKKAANTSSFAVPRTRSFQLAHNSPLASKSSTFRFSHLSQQPPVASPLLQSTGVSIGRDTICTATSPDLSTPSTRTAPLRSRPSDAAASGNVATLL
jgi:hypothetical protein